VKHLKKSEEKMVKEDKKQKTKRPVVFLQAIPSKTNANKFKRKNIKQNK
jgi:hypothetical protein